MANRLGHLAATKAHGRLGVDIDTYPVNVSKAIDSAGVVLMQRPMPRLFGVYIEVNGNHGVMVNSTMTRATRRHTAAHELGHHEFGHRPDPARQCSVEASESGQPDAAARERRIRTQGHAEMSAEAFAAWFLMPRRAVIAAMADLGIERGASPAEVYQLSLLLGATYRGLCRHLPSLRLARAADSDVWTRSSPQRLKRALADEVGLSVASTAGVDVWDLRRVSRARVEASVGDVLVLPADMSAAAESAGLTVRSLGMGSVALECGEAVRLTKLKCGSQELAVAVHDRPLGLYLPMEDPSLGEQERP